MRELRNVEFGFFVRALCEFEKLHARREVVRLRGVEGGELARDVGALGVPFRRPALPHLLGDATFQSSIRSTPRARRSSTLASTSSTSASPRNGTIRKSVAMHALGTAERGVEDVGESVANVETGALFGAPRR